MKYGGRGDGFNVVLSNSYGVNERSDITRGEHNLDLALKLLEWYFIDES